MSLVEVLNELRKIRGKYEKDVGIQTLSKFELNVLSYEQAVGTRRRRFGPVDCRGFPLKVLYVVNTQDVDVTIDVLHGPTDELASMFELRRGITVPAGRPRWGIVPEVPFVTVEAVAAKEPTRGGLTLLMAKWG